MNVRYFAAARAAAGVEEESFDLPSAPPSPRCWRRSSPSSARSRPAGTPPLARMLSRSSFLLNEVAVRNRGAALGPDDVVDVLPPFAGG